AVGRRPPEQYRPLPDRVSQGARRRRRDRRAGDLARRAGRVRRAARFAGLAGGLDDAVRALPGDLDVAARAGVPAAARLHPVAGRRRPLDRVGTRERDAGGAGAPAPVADRRDRAGRVAVRRRRLPAGGGARGVVELGCVPDQEAAGPRQRGARARDADRDRAEGRRHRLGDRPSVPRRPRRRPGRRGVRTVSFSSPYLLFALAVVPVAALLAVWFDRRRARYAVAFTNLDLLASVVPRRRSLRRWVPLALFLLALAAASVALARPRATVSQPAQRATLVLLVDVSGSMRASDVKPSRLGAAQAAMTTFAGKVPKQVKVGLISFSTSPNVLVVPTQDRGVLQEGIDLLAPEGGTAIGDGLGVAVEVARSSVGSVKRNRNGLVPAAIVLLSDGAQTRGLLTPQQGAERARAAGIRVYTIALGTNHGTLGVGPFGGYGFGGNQRFPVRPDPATLAMIARVTGGETYRARSANAVKTIYSQLGSSIARHKATREVSSWFVGAAALLLLGSLGAVRLAGERLP